MTTERHPAAKLAAPTINLASVVYGLDAYMRSRGAHAGEALRRAGLEPEDLTDPDRRVLLIRYLELLEICADVLADRERPRRSAEGGAVRRNEHRFRQADLRRDSGDRRVGAAHQSAGNDLPSRPLPRRAGGELADRAPARSEGDDNGQRQRTSVSVG